MRLFLQFLGRHLHNGNAPMRELVDELRTTRSGDLGSLRLGDRSLRVPSTAATLLRRASPTNSVGDKRSAESAPAGISNVTVGISTFSLFTKSHARIARPRIVKDGRRWASRRSPGRLIVRGACSAQREWRRVQRLVIGSRPSRTPCRRPKFRRFEHRFRRDRRVPIVFSARRGA